VRLSKQAHPMVFYIIVPLAPDSTQKKSYMSRHSL
jgi:hypothetical protein